MLNNWYWMYLYWIIFCVPEKKKREKGKKANWKIMWTIAFFYYIDNVFPEYCAKHELKLNTRKCKICTNSRSRNPIIYRYCMGDLELTRIKECNDLGLLFMHNLYFNNHIDNIIVSAYKSLNFKFRTCKKIKSTKVLFIMYNSFVRSKLEFSRLICSPRFGNRKNPWHAATWSAINVDGQRHQATTL